MAIKNNVSPPRAAELNVNEWGLATIFGSV